MRNETYGNAIGIARVFVLCFLLFPAVATTYDVDGDHKEGLAEAIHALQVAAGQTPAMDNPVGTATADQVFAGVTFSNETTNGLTGTYHGPMGYVGPDLWDLNTCAYGCANMYGNNFPSCIQNFCIPMFNDRYDRKIY